MAVSMAATGTYYSSLPTNNPMNYGFNALKDDIVFISVYGAPGMVSFVGFTQFALPYQMQTMLFWKRVTATSETQFTPGGAVKNSVQPILYRGVKKTGDLLWGYSLTDGTEQNNTVRTVPALQLTVPNYWVVFSLVNLAVSSTPLSTIVTGQASTERSDRTHTFFDGKNYTTFNNVFSDGIVVVPGTCTTTTWAPSYFTGTPWAYIVALEPHVNAVSQNAGLNSGVNVGLTEGMN